MPHRKWYLLVDDDTYLVQPSLNLILSHLDPAVPHYLGNAVGDYRQRFAHGGSAIALSHAALRALFPPAPAPPQPRPRPRNVVVDAARRESLTETWGDRLLARALLRRGVPVDEGASRFFNGEPPWAARLRGDRFCAPVAAFHRLAAPGAMAGVGRVFRRRRGAAAGAAAGPVRWVDLWAMYGAPAWGTYAATPLRRGWDHVGALDEQTRTVEGARSAGRCWRLCQASRTCLAWTWEGETGLCHMSPWVTVGTEAEGKVSGVHVERTMKLAEACL